MGGTRREGEEEGAAREGVRGGKVTKGRMYLAEDHLVGFIWPDSFGRHSFGR